MIILIIVFLVSLVVLGACMPETDFDPAPFVLFWLILGSFALLLRCAGTFSMIFTGG